MTKEVAMKIKPGDDVDFIYEGVRMKGYVTCINSMSDGGLYFDIKCNDMEFSRIPYYSVLPSNHPEEAYFFFDTDMAQKFAAKAYDRSAMKDILNNYYRYIKNDEATVKGVLNSYYGINGYGYGNKKQSIKVYQTKIEYGDRKGLYTTVIFRYHEPIVVKKDSDAADDILIAIAYANAKRVMGSNSRFKKRVDKNTVKIGKDYVISVLSTVFVPGEVLKRKRWDIYTYVAVQELFKRYSTKDIIDAIDNITYMVKEK